jgi:hypothetical protein
VGRALVITTIVLVAGFAILGLSSFRLNADMGQLSALVIFLALVVDFIFLPTLLMLFDKDTQPESQTNDAINQANNPSPQQA